jgi:hypothetical protein
MSEFKFFRIFARQCCVVRKFARENPTSPLFLLTIQRTKAYQAVGVNFLPMSASSELEPGPSRESLIAEFVAQVAEGVREASHEMWVSVREDAWGGFTAG